MQVGDLVTRNPDFHSEGCDIIGIITSDDVPTLEYNDEYVEVLWSDGHRMIYSIYELEAICK